MTVRNIKVAALANIGRLEDAIPVLRSVLEIDDPENRKHTFNKDVIGCVKAAVQKQENPTITEEFTRIEKYFNEQGHISEEVNVYFYPRNLIIKTHFSDFRLSNVFRNRIATTDGTGPEIDTISNQSE